MLSDTESIIKGGKTMANWTPKELEELLEKMTQKSMTDAEFR